MTTAKASYLRAYALIECLIYPEAQEELVQILNMKKFSPRYVFMLLHKARQDGYQETLMRLLHDSSYRIKKSKYYSRVALVQRLQEQDCEFLLEPLPNPNDFEQWKEHCRNLLDPPDLIENLDELVVGDLCMMRLITYEGVISQERLTRVKAKSSYEMQLESGHVLRPAGDDNRDVDSLLLGRSIQYWLSVSSTAVIKDIAFLRLRRVKKPYSLTIQAAQVLRKTYSTPAQRRHLKKTLPCHLREIVFQCPR